jgi:hypothetical protein
MDKNQPGRKFQPESQTQKANSTPRLGQSRGMAGSKSQAKRRVSAYHKALGIQSRVGASFAQANFNVGRTRRMA